MRASILTGSNIISLIRFTVNESTNKSATVLKMPFHLHGRGKKEEKKEKERRGGKSFASSTSLNLARPLMAHHFRAQLRRVYTLDTDTERQMR